MRQIFHVVYCEDFEAEGFFDEAGNYLAGWDANDAIWRNEYMDKLLAALDIMVTESTDPQLIERVKKFFGG